MLRYAILCCIILRDIIIYYTRNYCISTAFDPSLKQLAKQRDTMREQMEDRHAPFDPMKGAFFARLPNSNPFCPFPQLGVSLLKFV